MSTGFKGKPSSIDNFISGARADKPVKSTTEATPQKKEGVIKYMWRGLNSIHRQVKREAFENGEDMSDVINKGMAFYFAYRGKNE